MSDLNTLLAQRAQIDAAIAEQKREAAAGILAQMAQLGITLEDLGGMSKANAATGAKRPIKYRDENGNTWTGVGQRPRWIRAAVLAGATLEQFAIPKAH